MLSLMTPVHVCGAVYVVRADIQPINVITSADANTFFIVPNPFVRLCYCARKPVVFRFGTKPTGISLISFIVAMSTTDTLLVTALAT